MRIDPAVWAQLAGCAERREAIRATYQTFAGRVSQYELHPYHLLAYQGNWYALALNTARDKVETFALSRFRRMEAIATLSPSLPASIPKPSPGRHSGSPAATRP